MLTGPLEKNYSENLIAILGIFIQQNAPDVVKWRSFCPGLNVLKCRIPTVIFWKIKVYK